MVKEKAQLKKEFEEANEEPDLDLTFDELKAWAAKKGLDMSDTDINNAIHSVDYNEDGLMSKSEFFLWYSLHKDEINKKASKSEA
ncbi:hypothetical protein BDV34DRAFT_224224 [Aspergillus parasiticus]|uniref:EF-hand domain-containing protein n=1 Tax=Aspergillus parasiticus TaxID=5067 RepID=A0A5N6DP96_ASPPA|nr:hypothetical protein BDV34DRAFT_224224 [Aspergillus parasiticus]